MADAMFLSAPSIRNRDWQYRSDASAWCHNEMRLFFPFEMPLERVKYESLLFVIFPWDGSHCSLQFPILFIVAYNSRLITVKRYAKRRTKNPAHKQNQSSLKAYRYTQQECHYCRLFVIENYLLGASISLISYGARTHFMAMSIVKKTMTTTGQRHKQLNAIAMGMCRA